MLEKITNQVNTGQDFLFMDFLYPLIMGIIISVILCIIAVIIIRKKKTNSKKISPLNQEDNAMNILKERLAKGEITKDEYEKLKKEFEK
jgi:putative membrane protein